MIQIVFQFGKDKDALREDINDLVDLSRKYFPQHDEAYEKRIAELEEKVRQLEQRAGNDTVTRADKSDANVCTNPGHSGQDRETEEDGSDRLTIKPDESRCATCKETAREERYFKIDGNQTWDSSAPFCADVDEQGNATFQFNVKNGTHIKYSEHPEEMATFCEIESRCDAPNHIRNIEQGTGKVEGTRLSVVKRAKIRLEKE